MKLKNIKAIDYLLFIKLFYFLAILAMIGILIWSTIFLYNNVYKTLSQADILTSLKQEVIEKNLARDDFYNILDRINSKTSASPEKISTKSPFTTLSE